MCISYFNGQSYDCFSVRILLSGILHFYVPKKVFEHKIYSYYNLKSHCLHVHVHVYHHTFTTYSYIYQTII